MDKEYWEQKEIVVYWWNFGKKTLDYRGTYKGFLDNKGIKVRAFQRRGFWGWHFKVSVGSCTVTLETPQADYAQSCDDVIKIFLSIMGDKATLETTRRKYLINW